MTFEQVQRRLAALKAGDIKATTPPAPEELEVVWNGRDELLPSREEHADSRLGAMPSLDWDEDTPSATRTEKRKYTRTGRYARLTILDGEPHDNNSSFSVL